MKLITKAQSIFSLIILLIPFFFIRSNYRPRNLKRFEHRIIGVGQFELPAESAFNIIDRFPNDGWSVDTEIESQFIHGKSIHMQTPTQAEYKRLGFDPVYSRHIFTGNNLATMTIKQFFHSSFR